MSADELLKLVRGGETSRIQFKENVTNAVSIAQEMVAFSNSKGGQILIGINDKTGEATGLSFQDIQRINNLLTTAANEHVKSPIIIETETVSIEDKQVIVVQVSEGVDKPYKDNSGLIFVKNGADKRKVTSNEELSRLLQGSGNLYAEEQILHHCTYEDLNWDKFKSFYEKTYKEPCEWEERDRIFENLRLGKDGKPNLAAALLFTDKPDKTVTGFFITAIWFWGNDIHEHEYRSSDNFKGNIAEQYQQAYSFVYAALRKVQAGQSFNSLGVPEVPSVVLEELLVNALIHRDYFIKDTIKLFLFENRIEIRSPGKLPNNLTTEQVKRGVRKKRNNILDSFAPAVLRYRGAGSGILRALEAYPHIDFINDTEAEQFTVIIHRPAERKNKK